MPGHRRGRLEDRGPDADADEAAQNFAPAAAIPRPLTRQLQGIAQILSDDLYVLPHVAVRARVQLVKVYLTLADLAAARQLLREFNDILIHRLALGTLADEVEGFRRALAAGSTAEAAARSPLTPAELRLLPYLPTHLTANRVLAEANHRVAELVREQSGHVVAHAEADQDALDGDAGHRSGEGIRGHLAAPAAQPVSIP